MIQTHGGGRVSSDLVQVSIDSLAFGHYIQNAFWYTVYIQEVSRLSELTGEPSKCDYWLVRC